jgi:D-arabinose 1-dehydrogenase-like Zn-dependent alcohol dehydrogenase
MHAAVVEHFGQPLVLKEMAVPTPLFDGVADCITLRGAFVGNREDMVESLAFGARGQVKAAQ